MRKDIDGFRAWMEKEELADNTIDKYSTVVKYFFKSQGRFTKENVVAYKKERLGKVSAKTVNLDMRALTKYGEYVGEPIKIKNIKIQKEFSVENVITRGEYKKLIAGLETDGNQRWEIYFKFLARTGMRVSEFLKVNNGDIQRGYIEIYTKGKVRRILFPKSLIEEAKTIASSGNPQNAFCTNRYGTRMTEKGINFMMKKCAQQYGIPKEHMHAHAFRHMFAIEFLKKKNNIALLADLMGHSSPATTAIYLRLSQEEQIKAVNAVVDW